METPEKRIRWRHAKGGMYEITGFGIDEATTEPEVYYRAVSLKDDKAYGPTWSRRCEVFFDGRYTQCVDDVKGPRSIPPRAAPEEDDGEGLVG